MARFSPAVNNFNAGEWGPRSYGRVDVAQFQYSLQLCENWIPTIQGPLRKRNGTTYVASVETPAEKSRLFPYILQRSSAFMLEISSGVINVYNSAGTDVTPTISGETPPWSEAEIQEIQWDQDGSNLYLAHGSHETLVFVFDGSSTASLTEIVSDVGPLQTENVTTTTTITASAVTGGAITLTASASTFVSTDVGRLVGLRTVPEVQYSQWTTGAAVSSGAYRWSNSVETAGRVNVYKATSTGTTGANAPGHDSGTESDGTVTWQFVHSQHGFARITAYASGTSVTASVVGFPELPQDSLAGTFRWALGAWSDTTGHASSVALFEQRLILGGTTDEPTRFDGSRAGDFTDFLPGGVGDTSAFSYSLRTNNPISCMLGASDLHIITEGGEYVASGSSTDSIITPTNIRVRKGSSHGSKSQGAVQVGEAILFVQAGGRKVREMMYNDNRQGYQVHDITTIAHHLGALGLNQLAHQSEPDSIVWTYSDSGLLLGYTYERDQEVLAWHRHVISGTAAAVESVAVIPDATGAGDRLWIIVKRTVNGGTVRYIEFVDESQTDRFADSCVVYSGVATTTITGLSHLEGEVVSVIADGAVHPDRTVASGSVTLQAEATSAVVGLPMTSRFTTQPIEGGSQNGVSQGKSKRIHNVTFRLLNGGLGLKVGPDADNLVDVLFRDADDAMDAPVPLFSGDTSIIPIEDGFGGRAVLHVEHQLPLPCTVVAIWPQMEVYDAR